MRVNFKIKHYSSALCLAFLLVSCAQPPENRLDKSSVKAMEIGAAPEENVNNFTEVLECVGRQIAVYGTKDFVVGSDEILNETSNKDLPSSSRTMLQSAFATLMETSNGKVTWLGYSSKATKVQDNLINENARTGDFKTQTVSYLINGSITQFEKDLQRAGRDFNLKIKEHGVGQSDTASFSTIATSLSLHDLKSSNMALYRGIISNRIISVKEVDDSTGLMIGIATIGGINFNVGLRKKEGISGALMNLMQTSAIEIAGKFYKDDFDYKECLNREKRKTIIFKPIATDKKIYNNEKPPLKIKIRLNKDTYNYGESITLDTLPSENGYLYVFYSANNKLVRIFPNRYESDTLVQAMKKKIIPGNPKIKLTAENKNIHEEIYYIYSRYDLSSVLGGMVGNTPTSKIGIGDIIGAINSAGVTKNDYVAKSISIGKVNR